MKYLKYGVTLFIGVLLFGASGHTTFAGSCSSVSGTTWSTAANWSAGCTGAGGIPGAGDDVTIATSHPVTLDINTPNLKSLTIDSTFDTGSDRTVNINGGVGSSGTLVINGTMNAHGSVINLGGQFQQFTGTFNAGTSTVNINLNGTTTFIYGNVTFYNLVFNPTMTSVDLPWGIGNSPIVVTNDLTISPSSGSTHTLTATMGNSISVGGTLTISPSGSALVNFDTGGNTLATALLAIGSGGTVTANNSTINLSGTGGTLLSGSGTFNAGTSTVNLTGNGSPAINNGSRTFYNLTSSGTGTKTVGGSGIAFASGGTLSVTNGTFNPNSLINASSGAALSVSGSGTILVPTAFQAEYPFGTVTLGTGSTVEYNENSPQTVESSFPYYNLTISGTGGWSKTANATLTVNGTLAIPSNAFDTGGFTLNVNNILENGGAFITNASIINITGTSGTLFTHTGGSYNVGTGTINLTGNGSAIFNSAAETFCNLTSSGTGTKTQGNTINLNNGCNFSVTNGTWEPGTYSVTGGVSSLMSVSNATINLPAYPAFTSAYGFTLSNVTLGAGSTVNYDFAGAQNISSALTYVNLSIGGSGTKSLNGTTTVTGTLTINAGTLTTTGSNYTLNVGRIVLNGAIISMNASTINITGTGGTLFTNGGGGIGIGTSTVNLTGNGDADILSGSAGFYNFTISGSGTKNVGVGTLIFMAGGTFSVTNGTFDSGAYSAFANAPVALSVTNATIIVRASTFGGSFNGFTTRTLGTGSTVVYAGSGTQTVDNTLSYYNLSVTGGGREVDFPTTGQTTVANAFTASGSVGSLLSLFSTSGGTQWTFDPHNTAVVSDVAVKDGVCSIPFYVTYTNLTDSGNNGSCWRGLTTTLLPVHGGGVAGVLALQALSKPTPKSAASPEAMNVKETFSKTLKFGARGDAVTALQKMLVAEGVLTMTDPSAYGYYGKLTRTAVEAFQTKYKIVSKGAAGYGEFGPKTRARANAL